MTIVSPTGEIRQVKALLTEDVVSLFLKKDSDDDTVPWVLGLAFKECAESI